jgi:hypothetical protein
MDHATCHPSSPPHGISNKGPISSGMVTMETVTDALSEALRAAQAVFPTPSKVVLGTSKEDPDFRAQLEQATDGGASGLRVFSGITRAISWPGERSPAGDSASLCSG